MGKARAIEMGHVFSIGDNFEADVLGAENFGFTPVFINRKQANLWVKIINMLIGEIENEL